MPKDLKEIFKNTPDQCVPDKLNMEFNWTAKEIGFGSFSFRIENKILICDNECMGKDFIKKMLCLMVDNSKFLC